jgi:DNA-binding CsgD family transcriptional regulator
MSNNEDFFIELKSFQAVHSESNEKLQTLIKVADSFSILSYKSFYLIDYFKKNFLHVSDNPIFLCGHTAEEVKELGYNFYIKNVPEEDQSMLAELNRVGFNIFESMDAADKRKCTISYDFHLPYRGIPMLVNHQISPTLLNDEGKVWIAMCGVSLSSHKTSGHIELRIVGSPKCWEYSLESHRWEEGEGVVLSEEEKCMLRLSAEGLTMSQISKKMCKSVDSLIFYRRNLFEKLNVKNITEAISFTTCFKLL